MDLFVNVTGGGITGASAVSDWLSDYDDCFSLGNYESNLLKAEGGLRDLQCSLLNENGDYILKSAAISRFLNFTEYTENSLRSKLQDAGEDVDRFKRCFKEAYNDFIKKITYQKVQLNKTPLECVPYNIGDKCKISSFALKKKSVKKIIKLAEYVNKGKLRLEYDEFYPFELFLAKDLSEEDFLRCASQFVSDFFGAISDKKTIVATHFIWVNSEPIFECKMFTKVKHIFVKRDLRDKFISCLKHQWITEDRVDEFILHHKSLTVPVWMIDNEDVMVLNFEDFVLNHEVISEKILDFLGISANSRNVQPKYSLERSRKNVGLWKNYPNQSIMEKIAKESL